MWAEAEVAEAGFLANILRSAIEGELFEIKMQLRGVFSWLIGRVSTYNHSIFLDPRMLRGQDSRWQRQWRCRGKAVLFSSGGLQVSGPHVHVLQ